MFEFILAFFFGVVLDNLIVYVLGFLFGNDDQANGDDCPNCEQPCICKATDKENDV